MQELAILLSSIAGAASAVAVRKFPRGRTRLYSMGTSPYIKNQINSLKIEKDILNKTIARLYEDGSDLTKIQKDKLLLKYQHQLGIILARLEKLESARHHPDLGPVGDGLITLMDQKLSQLDNRLYELSAKITASEPKVEVKPESKIDKPVKKESKIDKAIAPKIDIPKTQRPPMEITTLTAIPKNIPKNPFEKDNLVTKPIVAEGIMNEPVEEKITVEPTVTEKETILNESANIQTIPEIKTPETNQPKLPTTQKELPAQEDADETDDVDLETVKADILKTISELKQAEVE